MNSPEYTYRPWSSERRERASALAKRRLGAPPGHSTVYGQHVPDAHANRLRVQASRIAATEGRVAAAAFIEESRKSGYQIEVHPGWSTGTDAALRRYLFAGWTARQIGDVLGRTKNSVIGRAHRLGLRWPPNGRGFVPRQYLYELSRGHLKDEYPQKDAIEAGVFLISPMFMAGNGNDFNIAAYTGISLHVVRRWQKRVIDAGLWTKNGPQDLERYTRDKVSDLALILDVGLCLRVFECRDDKWFLPKAPKTATE